MFLGINETNLILLCLGPPIIEDGPSEVVAVEGEVITVFCSIIGNPSPKVHTHFSLIKVKSVKF